MGDYVYKVTSKTVELSNGETASVAQPGTASAQPAIKAPDASPGAPGR